jgi:hypothetical protein
MSHIGETPIPDQGLTALIWQEAIAVEFGGRDWDRTSDLVVANDALSQLSYTPM